LRSSSNAAPGRDGFLYERLEPTQPGGLDGAQPTAQHTEPRFPRSSRPLASTFLECRPGSPGPTKPHRRPLPRAGPAGRRRRPSPSAEPFTAGRPHWHTRASMAQEPTVDRLERRRRVGHAARPRSPRASTSPPAGGSVAVSRDDVIRSQPADRRHPARSTSLNPGANLAPQQALPAPGLSRPGHEDDQKSARRNRGALGSKAARTDGPYR